MRGLSRLARDLGIEEYDRITRKDKEEKILVNLTTSLPIGLAEAYLRKLLNERISRADSLRLALELWVKEE